MVSGEEPETVNIKQRFSTNPTLLEQMEDLRHDGWCVVLKCMPSKFGWIIEGSRSEYDSPCPDRKIGAGKWCCEAMWMGDGYKHGEFSMAKTAEKAMADLWWKIKG